MIYINHISGKPRFSTEINAGSKRKFTLMKEDYITLKFSVEKPEQFKLGDNVDLENDTTGLFELVDLQKPTYNHSTNGYDYELKLDAYYWKWKNKKFFYTPKNAGREASWSLTATLEDHMNVFLSNLEALKYTYRGIAFEPRIDWKVVEKSAKPIQYDSDNLMDALTKMAEAWECEWWVINNGIHFGRCEYNDPVDFELNVNVAGMDRSNSRTTYATRIYAFGSTKNIPETYRKKLVFDVKKVDGRDISDTARKLDIKYFPSGVTHTEEYTVSESSGSGSFASSYTEWTLDKDVAPSVLGGAYKVVSDGISICVSTMIPQMGNRAFLPAGGYTLKASYIYNASGISKEISIDNQVISLSQDQLHEISVNLKVAKALDIEKGASNLKLRVYVRVPAPTSSDFMAYTSYKATLSKGFSADTSITFLSGVHSGQTFLAVYNPELIIGDASNILRLPEGITASLGDMYTINNIIRGKVPVSYFSKDDNELTINGVVQNRLMLPVGTPCVSAYDDKDMTIEEAVEDIVIFEDVYPKYEGVVWEVIPDAEPVKDKDGKDTDEKYPVYSIRDNGLKNFTDDFRLGELQISFQTGKLAGHDFALNIAKSTDAGTIFDIVRNEDGGGRYLPDDILYPRGKGLNTDGSVYDGDTYVLSGFDTAFVSEDMLPNAEEELLEKAREYIEKSKIDPSTYNCKMMSTYIYNDGKTYKLFEVGDRVNLIDETYLENGRQSRIIGYEYNLDIPYDSPVYIVGETTAYSRIGELESRVDSLAYKGQTYTGANVGSGGAGVYVIGGNDKTPLSDRNVLSARRTIYEIVERALSRVEDDSASGLITFLKGLVAKGLVEANAGLVVRSPKSLQGLRAMFSDALIEEGGSKSLSLDIVEEGEAAGMSTALMEVAASGDGATTIGGLLNVDDSADDAPNGAVLIAEGNKWNPKTDVFLPTGTTGDGTEIKTFDALMAYIGQLAPPGVQRNLRVNNNLDSKNISASKGEPCYLKFTFVSQERYNSSESYEDTGERGLCQISVKNTTNSEYVVVKQMYVNSSTPVTMDVAGFLTSGANNVMVKVVGEVTEETTPAFVYTVQLTALSIDAGNFKWWTAYTDDITFPLNIGGNISKTLYVNMAGEDYNESYSVLLGTQIYIETAYNYAVRHPERNGVFTISAYVANSDGSIKTKTVSFNVICVMPGAGEKLIAINHILPKAMNWSENTLFDYAMYDGGNVVTSAFFRVEKEGISIFSSNEDSIATSTKCSFSLPLEVETLDNSDFEITTHVSDGDTALAAPVIFAVDNSNGYSAISGAVFYMNPRTRSNRQENRQGIINEMDGSVVSATWQGMNWGNDGWTVDNDGNKVLRLMAGSLLSIGYHLFQTECARKGKTLEIDYRVDNVTDYSEPVLTISTPSGDSFVGLNVYADEIIMHSQSLKNDSVQSLHTFEGMRLRLTLAILPDAYGNSGFNLCILYVNGVKNREFTYENNDYFAQPGEIVIGSTYADIDVYGIREYDSALTSQGVLTNYINWLASTDDKTAVKTDNDILDSNGSEIDFENTKDQFNVMVYDNTIPSLADQSSRVGTLDVFFYDHPDWNVSISNVAAKGQGTSSMKYWIWNTRYQLDKTLSVITHADGTTGTKKWQMTPNLPGGQKFTAKKNYASSMQSHKIGAVNSYTDLYKEVGLLNESMQTEKYRDARVSVYELPFFCFEKQINDEGDTVYLFRGLYTFGPDKGDKYTFGFDTDLFPGLISIEGSDNSPLCTLFRVPWNNNVFYNEDEEAWQYNGANSWGFGEGELESISKFVPAYNIVYQCSPRLKPFNGTLDELNAQASAMRTEPYEFWIAKAGDANQYNLYYFEASQGIFIPSDIGSGTINLVSQLVDKGYGLTSDNLTGKANDELNTLFVNARIAKFRVEAPLHWDIDDTLLFMNNVEFNAGTDERAKNTYPYNFGTGSSKFRWRIDDADTRFDTTNRGLPDKEYGVETHDVDETGASVWNGETNNFFNLMELAFPVEKVTSMRKMMTAMQQLGGLKSGNDLEKIYAFYRKYFFDNAQEYFPANSYNADARYCYENGKLAYLDGRYSNDTDPITQSLGDHYLAEQRWITKRIVYMMSKYSFGLFSAAGTDTITVRAAGNTIKYSLTPAMDMYPAISNGTSIIRGVRTKAGEECGMEIELSGSGDQQNAIQGASYLQDIGDWHDKNVSGSMVIQGRMLREIRLGSKTEPIVISISSLTVSNCVSLQKLVLSNIATLTGALNLTACSHLKEVYVDGTSIVQLRLPFGGGLEKVEFSAYNQYLQLSNYPLMTNEGVGIDLCKGGITDFFVVDCSKMQPMKLLVDIMSAQAGQTNHALKRVRAVGFDETYNTSGMLDKLAELADGSYEGLSSDGLAGEDTLPVLDGKLTVYANAYEDSVEALKNTFKKLMLNVTGKLYIHFKDSLVEQLCVQKWDKEKDGYLTKEEVESATEIDGMMFENKNIISFEEFGTYFVNVTTIGLYAFRNTPLERITFPLGLQRINNNAFEGCKIREVNLLDSVTTINGGTFMNSTIEHFTAYGIKDKTWDTFRYCKSLVSVVVDGTYTAMNDYFCQNCTNLLNVRIADSVLIIRSHCFSGCAFKEFIVPPKLQELGFNVFDSCKQLEVISLPNSIVKMGGDVFRNASSLKTVEIKAITPPPLGSSTVFSGTSANLKIYVPDESVSAYKIATNWGAYASKIYPISSKPTE